MKRSAWILMASVVLVGACHKSAGSGSAGATDNDADTDIDIDVDSDSDVDTGTDTGTETESDTDSDTGTGTDTGIDTDTCDEGVASGDVTLDSQAAVEGFAGHTSLTGSIWIDPPGPETLVGLECLTEINGSLHIAGASQLTNLDGLDSLTYVGGIHLGCGLGNPVLVDVDGLESLTQVGGDFQIEYNLSLVDLDGLSNLVEVGGEMRVSQNYVLEQLSGLDSLTSVGDLLQVTGNSSLPTCEAADLRDQLVDAGWEGEACIQLNQVDDCADDESGC